MGEGNVLRLRAAEVTYASAPRCQIANLPDLLMEHVGYTVDGCFVDVGAYDGETYSNTSPLADLGWRGVMFEPVPDFCALARMRHANNPRITIIQAAVGAEAGEVSLIVGGTISTTKQTYVEAYKDIPEFSFMQWGPVLQVAQVRLDDELERLGFPAPLDFVSVDVEGAEFEVLKGFDMLRWKPRLIVWETRARFYDPRLNWMGEAMNKAMDEVGYHLIQEDTINSIYAQA